MLQLDVDGVNHAVTGPGVTFRRCQWCGEDFADYQDEPYHEDCASKATAATREEPWWRKRQRSITHRRLGGQDKHENP